MSGFPFLNYLQESSQTHVHWVSDVIQPSHPVSLKSPFAFKLSQHLSLFQWANSSHQVITALELQLQHQSFQWLCWSPSGLTGLICLLSRDSQESSPAPQSKSINSSALSLLYGRTLTSLRDWWPFSWASLNSQRRGGEGPAQGLSPDLSLPSSTSLPLPSSAQNKTKQKTLRRKRRVNFKRGKHPWDQWNLHNPQWQTDSSRRAIWLNKDIRSLEGLSSLCHFCLLVFEIYFFSFQTWKPSAF